MENTAVHEKNKEDIFCLASDVVSGGKEITFPPLRKVICASALRNWSKSQKPKK